MKQQLYFIALLISVLFSQLSAQPFWSETFNNGIPAGWSNEDNGTSTSINILWEHCSNFITCSPAIHAGGAILETDTHFNSTSVEDGYIYVDVHNEDPALTEPFVSELTTTAIDCSSKNQVVLKFESYLAAVESPLNTAALVRVKSGNGAWQEYAVFPQFTLLPIDNSETCNVETSYLDISAQAANQSEVFIQWQWTGQFDWLWALDDIALFDYHPIYEKVVWGGIAGQGDFSMGFNGWTPNLVQGDCEWYWDAIGYVGNSEFGSVPNKLSICAPTGSDGAAVIHPEICFRESGATIPPFLVSELISPTIDLSSVQAGTKLSLKFEQLIAIGEPSPNFESVANVAFSLDNGQTWLDSLYDVVPREQCFGFENFLNSSIEIGLPAEAAGQADFKMKFLFTGNLFFWTVDDVRILTHYDNDLKVLNRYFAIAPNYKTPRSQVDPFGLLAQIENHGNLLQEEVQFFVNVASSAGAIVHEEQIALNTLDEYFKDTVYFENLVQTPNEIGTYRGTYYTTSAEEEEDLQNNTLQWDYEISENVFAKDNGYCAGFAPNASLKYEIGNCYFVKKGGENIFATHITFAIANLPQIFQAGLVVNLYQWKTNDSYGDANNNLLADENEIEQIGTGTHTVTFQDDNFITVPITDLNGNPLNLEDTTYYLATVVYNGSVLGQPVPLFIGGTEDLDYTAMFIQSLETGNPRYVSVIRLAPDEPFNTSGFGLDRIPVVRLHIDNTDHSKEQKRLNQSILLAPNPANDKLFLTLSLENTALSNVQIEVLDISGKIVIARQFQQTFVNQLPIETTSLSNGSYILRVISSEGVGSKKFVVMR